MRRPCPGLAALLLRLLLDGDLTGGCEFSRRGAMYLYLGWTVDCLQHPPRLAEPTTPPPEGISRFGEGSGIPASVFTGVRFLPRSDGKKQQGDDSGVGVRELAPDT